MSVDVAHGVCNIPPHPANRADAGVLCHLVRVERPHDDQPIFTRSFSAGFATARFDRSIIRCFRCSRVHPNAGATTSISRSNLPQSLVSRASNVRSARLGGSILAFVATSPMPLQAAWKMPHHNSAAVTAPVIDRGRQRREVPEQIEGFRRVRLGHGLDAMTLSLEVVSQPRNPSPVHQRPRPCNHRQPLLHFPGKFTGLCAPASSNLSRRFRRNYGC
jgi:hypothetical protein